MMSTFISATARVAPRLIVVVVLPTPPFWFAIAIMRAIERYDITESLASKPKLRALPQRPLNVSRETIIGTILFRFGSDTEGIWWRSGLLVRIRREMCRICQIEWQSSAWCAILVRFLFML